VVNTLIVLFEADELHPAVDLHPERTEPLSQDTLGVGLGQGQREGVGTVDGVQRYAGLRPSVQVELRACHPDTGRKDLLYDADPLEHLEAAGVDDDRAGLVGRAGQLVHHADGDVATGELACQQEPDRSRAHDEYVRIGNRRGAHALPQERTPYRAVSSRVVLLLGCLSHPSLPVGVRHMHHLVFRQGDRSARRWPIRGQGSRIGRFAHHAEG
jgi:hypothetical protein